MNDGTRGRFRNPDRAAQLRSFAGIRYGSITPTDVDGLIEFADKLFVFLELKLQSAPLDFGQRLCFERLCNALHETGRIAIAIVADHNTPLGQWIDCASCPVRMYFCECEWKAVGGDLTVVDLIDIYYRKVIGELPT